MSYVPAVVLAGARAVDVASMPDSFAVMRDVLIEDSSGGFTPTPTSVATGVCRIRSVRQGSAEAAMASRLNWTTAYAVDLPTTTVLAPADTLVVNGRSVAIAGVIDTGLLGLEKTAVVRESGV